MAQSNSAGRIKKSSSAGSAFFKRARGRIWEVFLCEAVPAGIFEVLEKCVFCWILDAQRVGNGFWMYSLKFCEKCAIARHRSF